MTRFVNINRKWISPYSEKVLDLEKDEGCLSVLISRQGLIAESILRCLIDIVECFEGKGSENLTPISEAVKWIEDGYGEGDKALDVFLEMTILGMLNRQLFQHGFIKLEDGTYSVIHFHESNIIPIRDYRHHAQEIYERDGHKCVYCKSPHNLSLDHFVPQSKGGSHDKSNLVTACRSCNSSKGDKLFGEWLEARGFNL